MACAIAAERNTRLRGAMEERGLDLLVSYGNAWQCDYLRYVADFALLEGQGLAIARRNGDVALYLDSSIEAERARAEAPGLEVVEARNLVAEVEQVLEGCGNAHI